MLKTIVICKSKTACATEGTKRKMVGTSQRGLTISYVTESGTLTIGSAIAVLP